MSSYFDNFSTYTAEAFNAAFGEPVTYHPYGEADRPITASVKHKDNTAIGSQAKGALIEVTVINSAADGISNNELTLSQDEMTITMPNGSIERRPIIKRLKVTAGEIKLQLR